jgi:hypothetical protein
MSTARVHDIDVLKTFRAQIFKFAESAGIALGDAESEIHRTIGWLENDQRQHWESELRKRQAKLTQAKEKLRMKKVFSGPAGSKQSVVDEERDVQKCTRLVEEAQQKMILVKQWERRLQKELLLYKGQTQRFATSTTVDLPLAAAVLHNMITRLEAYASLAPASATSAAGSAESAAAGAGDAGMGRGEGVDDSAIAAAFAALRASTPPLSARAAAPEDKINLDALKAQAIEKSSVEILSGLPNLSPPPDGATVVVSTGIRERGRLYLERAVPAGGTDCGWFIAAAEVGENPFIVRVPVAEVLALRPELAAVLALPRGSLVILDEGAVGAVLGSDNKDIWAAASMKQFQATVEAAGATEPVATIDPAQSGAGAQPPADQPVTA